MEDRTNELIERAYTRACEAGFHDKSLSVEHMLMLVLCEVSEAIEADRSERYVDISNLSSSTFHNGNRFFVENYRLCVSGTVGDELADVCIRMYDMCGAFGIVPRVEYDSMEEDFNAIFGNDSFVERMYYLSRMLCSTSGQIMDDGTDECLPNVLGQALSFVFSMCNAMHIDLMRHIDLKMDYNETRPTMHGKKY